MGFFGKLFEKKMCDLCGGEIGLLGNRKLEDGNCCKDCAKKLSPWFDERRHSTVQQIRDQLAAREANRMQLQDFQHTKVLGEYQKMYIVMKYNIPTRFVVSSADDYREANADILLFQQISSCTPDIRESRTELKYSNSQGEKVSYDPPRYEYRYDFYIKLEIRDCAYIDDMRFKLNRSSVELETVMPKATLFSAAPAFDPMHYPEYRKFKAMVDEICEIVSCGQTRSAYGSDQEGLPNSVLAAAKSGAVTDEASIQTALDAIRNAPTPEEMSKAMVAFGMLTVNHPDKTALSAKSAQAMVEAKQRFSAQATGMPVAAAAPAATATWVCDVCGSENTGKFCQGCGAPKPAAAKPAISGWTCFCGAVNTGKFCNECGTKHFTIDEIECSECSWTAEPGDRISAFCPNCGHKFSSKDIR